MTSVRRMIAVILPLALLGGLSGCALIEPAVTDDPPTALESCALGKSWSLDLVDLQAQLTTVLTGDGVPLTAVDAQGSQIFDWELNGSVTLTTDYTVTVTAAPAADQIVIITQVHSGSSTGKAYINGDVAIPRTWDAGGFSIETTATNNGTVLEAPPYILPGIDIDDSVGLELTCTAEALTVHPRGSDLILSFTKA